MANLTPNISSRILSLDFIRGIALLGILVLNIESFAFPTLSAAVWHISDFKGINFQLWWVANVFFEGSMRGLFSMLFGASCLLILAKSESLKSVDIYYRRLFWLFLFGLLNAYIFLWYGDILYSYAIAGMFLFPFRNLNYKWLIGVGFIMSFITFSRITYKYTFERKPTYVAYKAAMSDSTQIKNPLTTTQKEEIAKFNKMTAGLALDSATVAEEKKDILGDYKSVFNRRWKDGELFQTWKLYDFSLFWDGIMMMFIGMGLFKAGVFTNELKLKSYLLLSICCYGVALFFKIRYINSYYFDAKGLETFFETYTIPTGAYYHFQRILMTLGHVGAIMLFFNSRIFKYVILLISKVGQMALTNYLLQSIICGFYFYGFGFAKFAKLQIYEVYSFCLLVWAINILFSFLWLRFFRMGPFEWLWRSLTYWKKQPLIINNKI